MREYASVSPLVWIGKTGKALRGHMEAQILQHYLISSPHSNSIGIYYLPFSYILNDTGLSEKGALKGLQRLSEVSFMGYDRDSEVVFVYEMAKWQIGESLHPNDKQVKGIQSLYDNLPENPFLSKFFDLYADRFHLKNRRGSEGASMDLRSTETETETETEKTPPTPPPGGNVCEGKNSEPEKRSPRDYSPEFQEFWEAYPPREGPNDKRRAFSAWNARLREDHTAEAMIAGARKYFADCASSEKIGTPYVMQASTFLGPADPPHFSVKEAPATPENIDPEKRIELWLEKVFTEHGPIVEREGENLTPDQRQAYRFKPWIVCGCPSCRKPDAWKRWYDPALPWNPKHGPIMSDCDWPYEIPMQVKYRDSPWHICRCRLCLFRDTSAMMVG